MGDGAATSGLCRKMEKVTLNDIVGAGAYEEKRAAFRREIIDLKKHRRVSVGDKVSLVFENRATVIFQIQEMLRAGEHPRPGQDP